MKIRRFNEKKEETKTYKVKDYKDIFTEMQNVLELGSNDPIDVLLAVKDLKINWNKVNKNNLYFYQQD